MQAMRRVTLQPSSAQAEAAQQSRPWAAPASQHDEDADLASAIAASLADDAPSVPCFHEFGHDQTHWLPCCWQKCPRACAVSGAEQSSSAASRLVVLQAQVLSSSGRTALLWGWAAGVHDRPLLRRTLWQAHQRSIRLSRSRAALGGRGRLHSHPKAWKRSSSPSPRPLLWSPQKSPVLKQVCAGWHGVQHGAVPDAEQAAVSVHPKCRPASDVLRHLQHMVHPVVASTSAPTCLAGVLQLALRLPQGKRLVRRFQGSSTVDAVLSFVAWHEQCPGSSTYLLLRPPRQVPGKPEHGCSCSSSFLTTTPRLR